MKTSVPWQRLEAAYEAQLQDRTRRPASAHEAQDLKFAASRLAEGKAIGELLAARFSGPVRVLDLGSGNGGVASGVANFERMTVVALDHRFNPDLQRICFGVSKRHFVWLTKVIGNEHGVPVDLCLAEPRAAHGDEGGQIQSDARRPTDHGKRFSNRKVSTKHPLGGCFSNSSASANLRSSGKEVGRSQKTP